MTFYELLVYLAENEHLPVVMKDLGTALITIFIGVLIFIIPPSEKNIQDNVDVALKKYLISKEFINAKLLLSGVLLIYLPFLLTDLWNNKHSWAKLLDVNPSRKIEVEIFALFLSILGICIILYILYNCYKWIISDIQELAGNNNNYYNKLEKKYLTIDSEPSATHNLFYLIWKRKYEHEDVRKENKYFDYFITWLNKLYENREYEYFQNGLAVFSQQIQNRNLNHPYLFSKSFSSWLKLFFKTLDKKNTENASYTGEGLTIFSFMNILQHYIKFSLQDNSFILITGSLFSTIKAQSKDKPKSAIEKFFNVSNLAKILFEKISMWQGRHFPDEWKFHLDNKKDNIFGTIFLNKFFESATRFGNIDDRQRDEMVRRAYDKQIILENLFFDKIDTQVFSYFFRMIDMPMEPRIDAIKWLIEEYVYDFFYGGVGYTQYTTTIPLDKILHSLEERERQMREDEEKMEQNTFKFFWLWFRNHKVLQPESIKKNIGELRQIFYNKQTQAREFYRREYLIRIFEQWLAYYKKQSDNQTTTTPTTSIPEA